MKLFDVDIRQDDDRVVIALSGEIDLSTVESVSAEVEPALAGDPAIAVLDLREVTFLDSSGLRLLLRLDERQRSNGRRLAIVRGGRRVARVFELTGADEQLELVDDPSELAPD